jgi:hypothetical protein
MGSRGRGSRQGIAIADMAGADRHGNYIFDLGKMRECIAYLSYAIKIIVLRFAY